jgi:hypothetical protein
VRDLLEKRCEKDNMEQIINDMGLCLLLQYLHQGRAQLQSGTNANLCNAMAKINAIAPVPDLHSILGGM